MEVKSLPRLPVPELEKTMEKYLAQVEAVAPNHLEKTRGHIKQFLAGPGPKLQQYLIERMKNKDNWATEWWLSDMYLKIPLGLPINSNPGLVLQPRQFKTQHDQAIFLSRFLNELLNYQEKLDSFELEVDKVKSKDNESFHCLCMAQHYQMFRLYRRPGIIKDEHYYIDRSFSGNHVIIAYQNQFYNLPVRVSGGERLTESDLLHKILKIMESPKDLAAIPVGILTTAERPTWAKAREELLKHEQNRYNLQLLENSLCIVCIDNESLPKKFNNSLEKNNVWLGERDYANVLHHALHGGGSQFHAANRWFDKTVNFILGKDGFWGLTYEHSAGEAPAIFRIFEELTEKVDCMTHFKDSQSLPQTIGLERLEWYFSEKILIDINEARISFDTLVQDLDLCILWFKEYSKEFIKGCSISPDVFIQLALQLTYYRLHGNLVATYESAGIRRFQKGRVDVIRAASPEALAWVTRFCQKDQEVDSKTNSFQEDDVKCHQSTIYNKRRIKELFDLAVRKQTKEMNDNITGHGMDNHMMGLRYSALETGDPIPEIFDSEAYKIIQHFTLSTSQITTKYDAIGGYGPVVPNGYGCGYNIRNNGFIFSCSAFKSDQNTSAKKFAVTLQKSLKDMASMLQESTDD